MPTTKLSVRSIARVNGRHNAQHAEPSRTRSPLEDRPIEEIWDEFRETRSQVLRNYLMERFLPLVRYNAERIYARLPDEVDLEDLMSAGLFGLNDAINAFDTERNVKFETYCAPRIRGAILDELRSMDWVPRLVRHRTAKIEQARQRLLIESGRPPTSEEIADYLGMEGEEYDKMSRDGSPVGTVSITRKCYPSDGSKDVREIDVIKDDTQQDPVRSLQRKDLRELVTKGLSRAERLIVVLYYYEGMTMKEIGATLDLSESRVSQMHSSILLRLKAQMQHRARELEPID